MARFVLWGTMLFNGIEGSVGWANVPWLALWCVASMALRSYAVFFYATSFWHYVVYIGTYHQRRNIAFPAFKRDALLYKTLALAQAGIQFAARFDFAQPDLAALALLVAGFGLATLAAHALGVDRTYFGWELGEITGEWVQRFPYGVLPHPMILGGCIGWLGFHKLDGFREAWPYCAPLHICLYLVHALQEHWSIHSNGAIKRAAAGPPELVGAAAGKAAKAD
eukprot:6736646-Prymnesium_polylepis.1